MQWLTWSKWISFPFLSTLSHPMAEPSLQAIFQQVFITQSFLHQLQTAEEFISDISDHLDEFEVPHEDNYVQIRTGIRQLRIHLNFLLAIQLLEACRGLERYMQRHGRLPNIDLNFQWHRCQTLRFSSCIFWHVPTRSQSAMHDSETNSPHCQKSACGSSVSHSSCMVNFTESL